MLRNLWTIARITCLDLWTRRVGAAYVGIALVFFGLSGTLNIQTSQTHGMDSLSTYSTFGMGNIGIHIAKLLALYVAAKSVDLEVQQRTLSAVMIRPVARHAYLLGRLSGVMASFLLFLVVSSVFTVVTNLKNGAPVDPLMPWALASAFVSTLTWTAILLPLAAVTSFPLCLGTVITLEVVSWWIERISVDASPWAPYLKDAVFYLAPVEIPAEPSLQAALAVAASLAYGAALFCGAALVFARQDLRLRA